ncbi:hypothetical protein Ddc_08085 [Ditylenchus destructor]|nr:hypothetical protein Ddc_08085 [Ditylenchus destructor]
MYQLFVVPSKMVSPNRFRSFLSTRTQQKRAFVICFIFMCIALQGAMADCGCGARCQKYSNDQQCARCCTATVRRSVPISEYPEFNTNNEADASRTTDAQKLSTAQFSSKSSINHQPFLPSKPRGPRMHLFDQANMGQYFLMHRDASKMSKTSPKRVQIINELNKKERRRVILAEIMRKLVLNDQRKKSAEHHFDNSNTDSTVRSRLTEILRRRRRIPHTVPATVVEWS